MTTKATADKPIVVITGASGAIGTALSKALSSDYTVVGLDRSESKTADDTIIFDLTSDESVENAFKTFRERYGNRIDSVIHLAAYFDFTGEDNPLYQKINIDGTRRLLRELRRFNVGQFVLSSTMLVHAPCRPGERIDESTPLGPRWIYPQSKVETEKTIMAERGDIPVVLLRLAGMYDERSAVPTLAHQIARVYERAPKSHFYSGNLEVGQSTVHKDDMLDAFRRTVDHRSELPRTVAILIGEEDPLAYGELQDALGRLIHGEEQWTTLVMPKPLAKAGAWSQEKLEPVIPDAIDQGEKPFIRPFMIEMADDHYALDISRARTMLGWEPRHHLREVLPDMVAVLKEDPKAWYKANGIPLPAWFETAAEQDENPERLRQDYQVQFRTEHAHFLWAHFFTVTAGCWLLVAPFLLEYESVALSWSNALSGIAITVLALLSLSWRLANARWGTAVIGVWLLLSPLLFWAPTQAAYMNSTFVGALVIGLAVLSRPPPGVSPTAALTGPTIPVGWTASPSSWFQRLPVIGLAFVGLFSSLYMGSYQLGHIETIWDPFFSGGPNAPSGTAQVITSDISEAFPVPNAGLGAVVYMLEILLGVIGSAQRWRTMPWVVAAFGVLIVPLGIVSITFIIIQPILIGTWCALCLIAAAAMLLQIAYASNELVATAQFLRRRSQAGHPWLRVFFTGDTDEGETRFEQDNFERPPGEILKNIFLQGVTVPWNLALCVLIGAWLMFTRVTLGNEAGMANADHLIGAFVITVSIIAWAEVARSVRYLNIVLGIALLITPFVFGAGLLSTAASIVCGVLLIALCLRRGPVNEQYGTWDRLIT